jgi:hypothetical protein
MFIDMNREPILFITSRCKPHHVGITRFIFMGLNLYLTVFKLPAAPYGRNLNDSKSLNLQTFRKKLHIFHSMQHRNMF